MPAGTKYQKANADDTSVHAVPKSRCSRFCRFLKHQDDHGQTLICGNTSQNWCYIFCALVVLYIITVLYWWLMFELVMWGNTDMLMAFLVVFIIFCVLWWVILYQGHQELKAQEEKEAKDIFEATRSRQSQDMV